MKKRVFKYKFVYWIILSLNIILFISFSIGLINRIETDNFDNSIDVFSFVAIIMICILSFSSLIMFIIKNKNSIITFSAVLFLILLIISFFLFYSIFIVKDFGENSTDFYTVPLVYGIILGILFITNYFKFRKNINELEIEELGQNQN
ncbi:magnesium-transporting ATPase (P-type) [Chryseobacterium sp. BIGb0186]|uniref:hypothetical protein n=1 Tax=Chryseobacterium sp. BIGb0186 TaxID=2940558 RepID=UPI0024753285|nr:hypothetical protein [Chryseobacterium sp. BIGb0186]MBM7420621.1 magnesium-transporting ATPase (P-type) [Chryseobacterium sp. JUb44]MDH6210574.1 magnesium-transporting ATPase (P-type) [Chryseobacterium sp. BIGb0186]